MLKDNSKSEAYNFKNELKLLISQTLTEIISSISSYL